MGMAQERQIVLLTEAAGGVIRHMLDLYGGLKRRNYDVKLILSPLRIDSRYSTELGGLPQEDLFYVPMRREPHPTDLSALLAIRTILKKFDRRLILHTHSTKAGMLGALLGSDAPARVHTPHAYRGTDPNLNRLLRGFTARVESSYSRQYDRVITLVPAEFDYALKIGVPRSRLRLISNGIEISGIPFEQLNEARKTLHSKPTLGFVGRFVYQKNPLLFVDVLNEVIRRGCDARAIIVGDGPLQGDMEKRATKYGIADRIDWRGPKPACTALCDMDIMVHTSLYEGLPYTLLEACAALLPVVATDNHGSKGIFDARLPQNISHSHNAGEIASRILAILNDNQLRLAQLPILQELAQQYSLETMVAKIEDEYLALSQ
jgi:glycosyltransferase involved in cell wall biosynthesis